jgi:TatD DNase family protein
MTGDTTVRFLTDTHCHLNLNIFREDLSEILDRAQERGVSRILVPGIDLETSRLAVELSEKYPQLFAAVGIHPGDASGWQANSRMELRQLAQHPKVMAIGEIGLDYYRDRSPRQIQQEAFNEQLSLAAELELPVVIHNREALGDLWDALSSWQEQLVRDGSPLASRPGVLHSYDGNLESAQRFIEKGFFIGISGPVTFKNAQERQQVAAGLPVARLLIETDAPFLTPHPYRGRRNEPAYVAYVAEKISVLHQQPPEAIARATSDNAAQLFKWGAIL